MKMHKIYHGLRKNHGVYFLRFRVILYIKCLTCNLKWVVLVVIMIIVGKNESLVQPLSLVKNVCNKLQYSSLMLLFVHSYNQICLLDKFLQTFWLLLLHYLFRSIRAIETRTTIKYSLNIYLVFQFKKNYYTFSGINKSLYLIRVLFYIF